MLQVVHATEPTEILAFATAHPKLIGVKKEQLPGVDGVLYSLNYTEEANGMPAAEWHPITLRCRGLVIFAPLEGEPSFVIVPCPKFFNWPRGAQLPDEVTFRRKVDGSCIHAVAVALPELQWVVGTRNSVRSPQAVVAASMLPPPSAAHVGLTLMMELIDPDSDPHGETDAAVGAPGLRLLHAWQRNEKITFNKLHEFLPILGDRVSLVPQDVLPREVFLDAFDHLECAVTRDEVREGFVVEDVDGQLHKYKSHTWLKWSEVPIISERTVFKALKIGLRGKQKPKTEEAIIELAQLHFPHLTSEKLIGEWKWAELLESERVQFLAVVRTMIERAETEWESGLSQLAGPLEVAAGGAEQVLERKVVFHIPGAKPYALVAMASGRPVIAAEFIRSAKEDHSLADSLLLMLAQFQRVEEP